MHARAPAGSRSWRQPAVLTAAGLSVPVGFAQFGPAVALSDVADTFGTAAVTPGTVEQLALSGGVIGVGYALIRLSSLGSLAIAGAADRYGRRRVLLTTIAVGLILTATSALSLSYWMFVAIFALGRPFLSASNAVAGVTAAEYTDTRHRSSAIVLIAAGYAVGTGLTLIIRYVGEATLGFRGLFGLAILPVLLLPLAARTLRETDRFAAVTTRQPTTMLGRVPTAVLPRLLLVMLLTAGIALVTGPANTYVFFYGEQAAGLSIGMVTLAGLLGGPIGLLGLLVGRWGADRLGRRVTAAAAVVVAAAGAIVLYSGPAWAVLVGYPLSLFGQAAYGPPAGALDAELFRTEIRATVAGWLTVAGVLGASAGLLVFGLLWETVGFQAAAWLLFLPVAVLAWSYLVLPETRDRELDDEPVA